VHPLEGDLAPADAPPLTENSVSRGANHDRLRGVFDGVAFVLGSEPRPNLEQILPNALRWGQQSGSELVCQPMLFRLTQQFFAALVQIVFIWKHGVLTSG
jgi:hypothetical protein